MITIKCYENFDDVDPTAVLEVDLVDVGYMRRGMDLASTDLKGIMDFTQKNSQLNVSASYATMLQKTFTKIEAISGDFVTEIAQGVPYICTNISTKFSASVTNDTIPESFNTVFSFREYVG